MNNDEQAQILRREIATARANYFHCMDYRLYDLAEKALADIAAAQAKLAALS